MPSLLTLRQYREIKVNFGAVSNHGLEALVEEHFRESHKFFELPLEQKAEIMVDSNTR